MKQSGAASDQQRRVCVYGRHGTAWLPRLYSPPDSGLDHSVASACSVGETTSSTVSRLWCSGASWCCKILQGTVRTFKTRCGLLWRVVYMRSLTNSLWYISANNRQNWMTSDKDIIKIKRLTIFSETPCRSIINYRSSTITISITTTINKKNSIFPLPLLVIVTTVLTLQLEKQRRMKS